MRVSLIITTYNRVDALSLVLHSVQNQTVLPKEVIIADDGSTKETQKMIRDFQVALHLNLTHSWQKDKGFRAAKSRNKAIAKSKDDYREFAKLIKPRLKTCNFPMPKEEFKWLISNK